MIVTVCCCLCRRSVHQGLVQSTAQLYVWALSCHPTVGSVVLSAVLQELANICTQQHVPGADNQIASEQTAGHMAHSESCISSVLHAEANSHEASDNSSQVTGRSQQSADRDPYNSMPLSHLDAVVSFDMAVLEAWLTQRPSASSLDSRTVLDKLMGSNSETQLASSSAVCHDARPVLWSALADIIHAILRCIQSPQSLLLRSSALCQQALKLLTAVMAHATRLRSETMVKESTATLVAGDSKASVSIGSSCSTDSEAASVPVPPDDPRATDAMPSLQPEQQATAKQQQQTAEEQQQPGSDTVPNSMAKDMSGSTMFISPHVGFDPGAVFSCLMQCLDLLLQPSANATMYQQGLVLAVQLENLALQDGAVGILSWVQRLIQQAASSQDPDVRAAAVDAMRTLMSSIASSTSGVSALQIIPPLVPTVVDLMTDIYEAVASAAADLWLQVAPIAFLLSAASYAQDSFCPAWREVISVQPQQRAFKPGQLARLFEYLFQSTPGLVLKRRQDEPATAREAAIEEVLYRLAQTLPVLPSTAGGPTSNTATPAAARTEIIDSGKPVIPSTSSTRAQQVADQQQRKETLSELQDPHTLQAAMPAEGATSMTTAAMSSNKLQRPQREPLPVDSLTSVSAVCWYLVQEAARHCVSARMRTHFGGPTSSFTMLEKLLQGLSAKADASLVSGVGVFVDCCMHTW